MLFASPIALLLAAVATAPPPDLGLKGCVVARNEEASVAVLSSAGQTRIVAVGEKAFGGQLVSVSPQGAVLVFGAERVTVRMAAATTSAPAAPPPPAKTSETAAAAPTTTTLNMPRADVDRRVALEMDRILAETALAPVTEGGRVTGVAVRRLASGTVLSDVGLRVGDVITEINGTRIDGLATLMGLYSRLQGEKQLNATVLRDGQPLQIRLGLE
jgi:type II secretion system protein C